MKLLSQKTFIIAEAGVNHNGRFALAKRLVDAAKAAGADAVKFQTFKTEQLASMDAPAALYQSKNSKKKIKNQFELLKALELSEKEFVALKKYCDQKQILFLSTPFDVESLRFLQKINVRAFKIGSGDLTNTPFIQMIAKAKKPIILSTGMSTINEIARAIRAIALAGNKEMALLHCLTEYPAPYEQMNLKAMAHLEKSFGVAVGLSDHTLGIEVPIAAVAMGAKIIEKHLTLDKKMSGPDHAASLDPDEFAQMVKAIRHIEVALGDGKKRPMPAERKYISIVRKSLVATRRITRGTQIKEDMITIKRPGYGIAPSDHQKVIGKKIKVDIKADQVLEWRHFA